MHPPGCAHRGSTSPCPDDWGTYAQPWVAERVAPLECLKALHLRRMVVTDDDLAELIRARGHMLQELKLESAPTSPRTEYTSSLASAECLIIDKGSEWIHDLAVSNPVLVTLNFHMTELIMMPADLELLAKNCRSLISLKISDCDLSYLIGFFQLFVLPNLLNYLGIVRFLTVVASAKLAVSYMPSSSCIVSKLSGCRLL
ncbi:coronatine-insensitive protein homolog 1b-like [Phragmites australis]|uniref:coronatine-insensitive protein homolog 1b-like n=1 Tax=Phragmites australis TaxID=29695 RepID=UPI002D783FEE|nr:coronatine-insensitive protein homolog 1b-like [Phragmites australis]